MNEPSFQDAENFSHNFIGDKITFRDIILNHLRRISQFASVEWRGGYWEERSNHIGGGATMTTRVYIADTREVYSNAVLCMADMLFPYFDEEMLTAEEECSKAKEKAFEDNTFYVEPEREDQSEDERRDWKKGGKMSFRSETRRINQKLFRHLCSFLFRKKYLDIGTIED